MQTFGPAAGLVAALAGASMGASSQEVKLEALAAVAPQESAEPIIESPLGPILLQEYRDSAEAYKNALSLLVRNAPSLLTPKGDVQVLDI